MALLDVKVFVDSKNESRTYLEQATSDMNRLDFVHELLSLISISNCFWVSQYRDQQGNWKFSGDLERVVTSNESIGRMMP